MAIVTVKLLKQHTRTDDFTADDEYLTYLLTTAEQLTLQKIGYTEEQIRQAHGGHAPAAAAHAVMLLAGYWYSQREAVTLGTPTPIPYGYDMLVAAAYNSTEAYYRAQLQ